MRESLENAEVDLKSLRIYESQAEIVCTMDFAIRSTNLLQSPS